MPMLAPLGAWIASNAALLEGIAAAATVAGTGVSVGETISQRNAAQQAYQQQLTAEQQAQQQQQQQQAQALASTQAQQRAATARQYPNVQEQLGGAVAPDYYMQEGSNLAGTADQPGIGLDAFRQFLGDRSLTTDPSKGVTSGAGSFWDSLQPGQAGSDQISGGLT